MQSRRIFSLALPMIISNVTTPLIGLVDTAVIGHMPQVSLLAGVALGALVLTQIYWVCGFLRMSATGLSAQATGEGDKEKSSQVLIQTAGLGILLGSIVLLIQGPLLNIGLWFSDATPAVALAATEYFQIRVWSAPAALLNLALIGWLVGQQAHGNIMRMQIVANLLNVILDLFFVYVLDMGVAGVALASVIAELSITVMSLIIVKRMGMLQFHLSHLEKSAFIQLMSLNSNMLVRNLALQICLAFITYKGTAMGELVGSTNAIILQFFTLIALGLDGLAYATEALIGEAKGRKNIREISSIVRDALIWSSIFALGYSLVFWILGEQITALLTDIDVLRQEVNGYLLIVVLLPVISHWCFLFDGVYIGLTNARIMRNSMLICMLVFFYPAWYYLSGYENWGLWLSFLIFLALRGITLGGHFAYATKKQTLLN